MRKALATLALAALVAPTTVRASDDLVTEYFNQVFRPCAEVYRLARNLGPMTDQDVTELWNFMLSDPQAKTTYRMTATASEKGPELRAVAYDIWQMQCILRELLPNAATYDAVDDLFGRIVCWATGSQTCR